MTHSNKLDFASFETQDPPVRTCYSYTRISTPEQKKGSGLRRQIESAIAYCRTNKLCLDETLKLSDEGISAFKGDNIIRGKLGEFLRLVEKGKVKRGSVLLVESIDRISRQNVMDAQELFLSIVNRGITLVTLIDGQEYSREEIQKNPWKLMVSLSVMIRANEESETKSKRVAKSRHDRRKFAKDGKAFGVYCPPWCDFKDGRFVKDEHKASIIRRVFAEYLNGKGGMAISSTLNKERIPFFGRTSREWYKKVVQDLLKDKRVIGHAHWIDKDDYFPPVIDRDTFNRVQYRLTKRSNKGGQVGKGIINIFAGSMRCARCGGTVCKTRVVNSEGYKYFYLVCESARSGKRCEYRSIMYDAVEDSFLFLMRFRPWFQEMLTNNGDDETEIRIESLKGQLVHTQRQVEKFRRLLLDDDSPSKTIVSELKSMEHNEENLRQAIALEEGKQADKTDSEIDEDFFDDLTDKMKIDDFRLKVREVIRSMVKTITLHVHTKFPFYIVERTNGNFWSVVFLETKRKGRTFQIFKGTAREPDDDDNCEQMYSGPGKHG